MRHTIGTILLAGLFACNGGDGGSIGGSASGDETSEAAADTTGDSPTGGSSAASGVDDTAGTTGGASGDGCGARVVVAFFTDADCTVENQKGQRAYDTAMDCFSWTAMGSHAQENSATRFQCYSDRLCYTQHPNSLTCEDGGFGATDKQAKNAECIKEPEGMLYSKILGGNEGCPAAPPGFECPSSASKMGTDGIVACSSE